MKKDKRKEYFLFNIILIVVAFVVTIITTITGSVIRNGYDVQVYSISNKRYKAPSDSTNKLATEKLQKEAYDSVLTVYKKDLTIEEGVYKNFDSFFEQLKKAREEYGYNSPYNNFPRESEEIFRIPNLTLPIYLSDLQIEVALKLDENTYIDLKGKCKEVLQKSFTQGIKEDNSEKNLVLVKDEFEKQYKEWDLRILGYDIVSSFLVQNLVVDEDSTEKARAQKVSEVLPVTIKKNQTIVNEGQSITPEIYDILSSYGYIQKSYEENIYPMIGATLITVSLFAITILYINFYHKSIVINKKESLLLFTIYSLCILSSWLLREMPYYYSPILIFSMLVAIIIDIKFSILTNIFVSILVVLISNITLEYFVFYIFAGVYFALFSKYSIERNKILFIGTIASIMNVIVIVGINLFFKKIIVSDLLDECIYVFLLGLLSVIVSIGSLPFWEAAFGVVTPIKLLDLTNPNSVVLRRLTIEAPGTYHHSLIVANLAETAAYDIGANPTLARVGGYYHDIGKLKYPQYFAENQMGENLHDYMDPYSSVQVIKSHVSFGLELADTYNLPKIVKDMISEHHGNTLIKYFYHKAKTLNPAGTVKESDFRYDNNIPHYPEVAIIMLADTIEAAVRSVVPSGKSMVEVEELIRKLIKDKLEDGQLQDSMLTIKDLETITKAFMRVFKGMYHERVAYPKLETKSDKENEVGKELQITEK